MLTPSLNTVMTRLLIVAAVVATLGLVTFVLSAPQASAQLRDGIIKYKENGTGPVITFTATDPEMMGAVDWDVTGTDAVDFMIDERGVLTFKKSPNYESPKDRAHAAIDLNGDGDTLDTGEAEQAAADSPNNFYQITVRATEQRAQGDMGPAKTSMIQVAVMVENSNESGAATLDLRQPEVGTTITASVTDPDGEVTSPDWVWAVSKVQEPDIGEANHWEAGAGTAAAEAYTPAASDVGKFLRATVTYTVGTDTGQTARVMTEFRVRADVSAADNASPDFRGGSATSSVSETASVGTVVTTITAHDPDDDVLTYDLVASTVSTSTGDVAYFMIDPASGAISVKQGLDADGVGGRTTDPDPGTYVFTVRVTDSTGAGARGTDAKSFDTIVMTVTALSMNENPSVEGMSELSIAENTNLVDDDTTTDVVENGYSAMDEDPQKNVNWHLEGDDAAAFRLSGTSTRSLTFRDEPDFEMPTDANGDNVYKVTVVADDGDGGMGQKMVSVTVNDTDEDGKVTLSAAQPHLHTPLTATLADPDGDVTIISWQWSESVDRTGATTPFADIIGGTADTHIPTPETNGIGKYLGVTVTYMDLHSMDDPGTADVDERFKTASATSTNAVQAPPEASKVPEFPDSASERQVAENTAPGGAVGDPVQAMDGDDESHDYSLAGLDERFFKIDNTGQIMVGGETDDEKTDPQLDYEKAPNSYTVEVTARDGDGNMDTVTVTIMVTDVNEAPELMATSSHTYDENGTGAVATLKADDPEGMGVDWDVTGTDADDFMIDGGALMFKKSPDYESPTDRAHTGAGDLNGDGDTTDIGEGDDAADNRVYQIVVRATEQRAEGFTGPAKTSVMYATVTVEPVNEDGTAKLDLRQPEVGTTITASVTDPDGDVAGGTWAWSVSKVVNPIIGEANHWEAGAGTASAEAYTPAAADNGKYLRAVLGGYEAPSGENTATSSVMSEFRVRANVLPDNNASPDFRGGSATSSVSEAASVGTVVTTITAHDPDDDVLTYDLVASTVSTSTGDVAYFMIDPASGAISVKQGLDADGVGGRTTDPDPGTYVFTVRVTDSTGAGARGTDAKSFDTIVMTVTALPMNDNPSVAGMSQFTIAENANLVDDDTTTDVVENQYTAMDQDAQKNINWSLSGDDAAAFRLSGTAERTLAFRDEPDFEMPTDANGDNVYKVTVVVDDGDGGMGQRMVSVTVTNVEEDGKVTLSAAQPHLDTPITAMLADQDIPAGANVTVHWQWATSTSRADTATFTDVVGATSATFTPRKKDVGLYLRATATYMDGIGTATDTAEFVSTNAVLEAPATRSAPEFEADMVTREVKENTPSPGAVGDPVRAMDPDAGDTLTYKLGGTDAGKFGIDEMTGQISVKSGTELDYEKGPTTYTVTVTATDVTKLSDMVTVTIMVTDVNEAPSVPEEHFGPPPTLNQEPAFDMASTTRSVAENTAAGMNIGDPVTAMDADRGVEGELTYTLGGTDAASFAIDASTGQLMTSAALDYETKNMYMVEVTATDGGDPALSASIMVYIMVTDEGLSNVYDANEDGMIDIGEAVRAVQDFFAGRTSVENAVATLQLYFAAQAGG